MSFFITLAPLQPIIARDGRPFGANQGYRMKSLEWPYPSVLAGSLRTLLGKLNGGLFSGDALQELKNIEIAGPLPLASGQLYFPAPKDIAVPEGYAQRCFSARPSSASARECDLPVGLRPAMLPDYVEEDFKPRKIPAFWSTAQMMRWLINPTGDSFLLSESESLEAPEKDERMHVAMNAATGAGEESRLFMTVGLQFGRNINMAARVDCRNGHAEAVRTIDILHPMGGERRLVHWKAGQSGSWDAPGEVRSALQKTKLVRMVLATPAIFDDGWKPRWLKDGFIGTPGAGVTLQLIGACVDRWKPVSGWSFEPLKETGKPGPKAIRRLVPAGSVYFFEVTAGDAATLAEQLWLQPVSDHSEDRRDGFGLALWGVWDYFKSKQNGM